MPVFHFSSFAWQSKRSCKPNTKHDIKGIFRTLSNIYDAAFSWKQSTAFSCQVFLQNSFIKNIYWVLNTPLDTFSKLLYKLVRCFENICSLFFLLKLNTLHFLSVFFLVFFLFCLFVCLFFFGGGGGVLFHLSSSLFQRTTSLRDFPLVLFKKSEWMGNKDLAIVTKQRFLLSVNNL